MTGHILVDTTELINAASAFGDAGKQIKNHTQAMTDVVTSLAGEVWSGDAADAYKKKFNELQDDINKMIKMIDEHVTDLNAMAREYDAANKKAVEISNSLSGDVII